MSTNNAANEGAVVIDIADLRRGRGPNPDSRNASFIHLRKKPDGEIDLSYALDATDSRLFMRACLIMCARLLSGLPGKS